MEITHNKLNNANSLMEGIVAKGQPFAKRNKDRRLRATLGWMKKTQEDPITFSEVWFYFRLWITSTLLKRVPPPRLWQIGGLNNGRKTENSHS